MKFETVELTLKTESEAYTSDVKDTSEEKPTL